MKKNFTCYIKLQLTPFNMDQKNRLACLNTGSSAAPRDDLLPECNPGGGGKNDYQDCINTGAVAESVCNANGITATSPPSCTTGDSATKTACVGGNYFGQNSCQMGGNP